MIVIPVYNRLIVPDADIYFQTEQFKKMAGRAVMNEKVVILICKEETNREDMTEESFYPIGVSGSVSELGGDGFVTVHTTGRVNIDQIYVNPDHTIDLTISRRPDEDDISKDELAVKLVALKRTAREFANGFTWGPATAAYLDRMETIGSIASMVSPWLGVSNADRYAVLEEDSLRGRTPKQIR